MKHNVASNKQRRILVTGGNGFIGAALTQHLASLGYAVESTDLHPAPSPQSDIEYSTCNLVNDPFPPHWQKGFDAVIHLAGVSIFGRWTQTYKEAIYNSRIVSTQRLIKAMSSWEQKPSTFICASAFGIYGNRGEELLVETSKKGDDFLARVCVDWEKEAAQAENHGIRSVQIRTVLVLGEGGLLKTLTPPFRLGLGGWIGKGKGWFPWIHKKDLIRHRPVLLPIPTIALRVRYGELAKIFTFSAKLSVKKLQQTGFTYTYPNLNKALKNLL